MESVQKKAFVVHALPHADEKAAAAAPALKAVPLIIDEEKKERKKLLTIRLLRLLAAVLIFVGWEVFTRIGVMDPYFWSSPGAILHTTWPQMTEG